MGDGDCCGFEAELDGGNGGGKCECKCDVNPICDIPIPILIWWRCWRRNSCSNFGFTSNRLERFECELDDELFTCDCVNIVCPFMEIGMPASSFFFCLRSFARLFWNCCGNKNPLTNKSMRIKFQSTYPNFHLTLRQCQCLCQFSFSTDRNVACVVELLLQL